MNSKTAEDRMRYARQYHNVLITGGAQVLVQLPPDKRIHIQKALSNLAKFTGQYDTWLQLRQRYSLKWSSGTEKLDAFERFFDSTKTLDTMLQWLREVTQALPKPYSDFFVFCTLTGLRASECVNCIRLIKNPETFKIYYDPERQALCHFKFPDMFIRRTKAAYISLLDKQLLQIAQDIDKTPTYDALKMVTRRRNLSMNLKYCRKIYASWLRQKAGIESEIVDLLQGRVPKSVFVRHYLTPSLDYKDKVLQALNELKQKILY